MVHFKYIFKSKQSFAMKGTPPVKVVADIGSPFSWLERINSNMSIPYNFYLIYCRCSYRNTPLQLFIGIEAPRFTIGRKEFNDILTALGICNS